IADRNSLVSYFVPNHTTFLRHLGTTRAVIGGLSALSFVLRDTSIQPSFLEIFVPSSLGKQLVKLLTEDDELGLTATSSTPLFPNGIPQGHPRISGCVIFVDARDRLIVVFTSASESALDPITFSPASALINWVSPYAFGCGSPSLTLHRRSLIRMPEPLAFDLISVYALLASLNFDLQVEPSNWTDWRWRVPASTTTSQQPCMRNWYICPDQARFFGDHGSLVTVFELLTVDVDMLRLHRQPPYGITVAWRMRSDGRSCTFGCDMNDPILPAGIHAFPVIFVENKLALHIMY
ncbi:hypothetical protein C2E23DRAFT_727898, partial [Lenzites betulinus]